jgi:hypothetical protein
VAVTRPAWDAPGPQAFEAAWAARAGITVAELHRWGRWPEPCLCGYAYCEGWVMGHQHEDALAEDWMRSRGLWPG